MVDKPLVNCKTKLLLVNPKSKPGQNIHSKNKSMYPYSLLFLLSYLYKNGYTNGRILDLSCADDSEAELREYLKSGDFDVVGFTSTTESRFLVWDLIRATKKILPRAKIIVGGNHFTYTAELSLGAIKEIDIVVRGEGELTLLELMQIFEKGDDLSNVLGISYRKGKKIVHTDRRPAEDDLNKLNVDEGALQFIDVPNGDYSPFMNMRNYTFENLKTLPIHVGRGCPGRCVFCLYNKKKYRMRSVDSVLQEINHKIKKYNCHCFHLQDPFLVKREDFIRDFCNRLLNEKINIKWYAESRVDINPELLELMSRAGCISMDFGLESVSPRVITAINKNINVDQAETMIQECHRNKIRILMFIMVSLPDERDADSLKTLDFIKKHRDNLSTAAAITRIYPGTELERMAKERGIIDPDFDWYDRNYVNQLQDPSSEDHNVPIWLEYRSIDSIKNTLKEIDSIQISTKPLLLLVLQQLKPFLFDWKNKGLKYRIHWGKIFLRAVYLKLFYLIKGI